MFALVKETTREKDWDSIAAIHRHSKVVTTWSYDRSCMGAHKPLHERFKGMKQVEALCITISTCGNFVLIGYNTGHLDKFNIQSGIYRGSFGKITAHEKSVRGIVLDGFNQLVISGSADKLLKFWKFKDHSFLAAINLQQSVAKIVIHRDSAMVAVALDDFSIVIIDIETRKIIRRFEDISGSITDMTFSPDSRWFVAASSDSSIKTWDIPSGRLVDWFLVSPICVSLALSPTAEYLATAHAGDLGIYLWANSTLYMNVSLHPLPDNFDPQQFDLPMITLQGKDETDDETDDKMEIDENVPEFKSPKQISDELVTLSLLPQSKWLNLLDLDVIKRRNKPKEPVHVPKNAPFFLPVVSGLNPTFMIDDKDKKERGSSKVLHVVQHKSEFSALLEKADNLEKYEEVFCKLKELSPSNVDVEIRCLSPENGGSIHLMETFLKMINAILKMKTDFEVVNSYSSLFLQIHYETAGKVESLREILKEILESIAVWKSLQEKMNYILCVGKYAMGVVL